MGFDYNLLLEYLSYKKCGKWIDFKKYVNNLNYNDIPYYDSGKIRRTLSALGHVEFDFSKAPNEYIVAPPVISMLPNSLTGVLCGYRTKNFLKNFENNCNKQNIIYQKRQNNNAPDVIFVKFNSESQFKKHINNRHLLNVSIIENFSSKILKLFPKFELILKRTQPIDDIKKPCSKYEINMLKKKPDDFVNYNVTFDSYKDNVVYETSNFGRKKYYIYDMNLGKFREVDKYIGIISQSAYYYENKKMLIHKDNKLYVNKIKGFPELIDRALTLSSGYNRSVENQYLVYDNISVELAELLSEKTGLVLEVKKDG